MPLDSAGRLEHAAVRLHDALAIDRPSPAPVLARGRRAGSNGAAASSGGRPRPSSSTLITTSAGPASALTCTRVPGGLWPNALFSRFTKTCSIRSWSAHTTGRLVSQVSVTSGGSGGRQAIAASITSRMSHQSRCSRMMPDSMAEKSSRSSTSRPRRADSAAIRSRKRCWESRSQVTSGCSRLDA